jgi:phenylacetate-CoA ligase
MDLERARERFPLLDQDGLENLRRIQEHRDAPRWTHLIGDHLVMDDLEPLHRFRQGLDRADPSSRGAVPDHVVEGVLRARARLPAWQARIPQGMVLPRDWAHVPTSCRDDLASHPEDAVPADEPLDRLIVYETSGTTGHALRVPHHPRAVAFLHALAERALAWHGRVVREGAGAVACMNLRAQAQVWVYPSVFSAWRQAGFARVNLNHRAWAGGMEAARRFITGLAPGFLTGDPASLTELARWEVEVRPDAILSTALALAVPLRQALTRKYDCPVIDWYSTTETGPVACSKPGGNGLAFLAPDLHVELLDDEGYPVPDGQRGEITVTGGRNPYLPLLRYRTGDHARVGWEGAERRLLDLEGRGAVVFRAGDGSPVNPVDVGRALRHHFAVVQHQFHQRADGSCRAVLRPAPGLPVDVEAVRAELAALVGAGTPLDVELDPALGRDGKVVPYVSER